VFDQEVAENIMKRSKLELVRVAFEIEYIVPMGLADQAKDVIADDVMGIVAVGGKSSIKMVTHIEEAPDARWSDVADFVKMGEADE